MAQMLSTADQAERTRSGTPVALDNAPSGRLILVRAAGAAHADRQILEICGSYGLSPQAATQAGRNEDSLVVAIEVPASHAAGSVMLETQLRTLPGVLSVTVTQVGIALRPDASQHRA